MSDALFKRLTKVAGPVSRETFDELRLFENEFRRWSARINLVAPSTREDIWERHILDSAQLMPITGMATSWLDLGSGGGFPGAIVALMLKGRQGAHIDLVESNQKKSAFLRTVLGQLGAPAHIHAARIESLYKSIRNPDIVTARALAGLSSLLALTEPWLSAGTRAFFHKGREYAVEVEESIQHWHYDLVEHPSVTEHGAVILEIANLRRRQFDVTD